MRGTDAMPATEHEVRDRAHFNAIAASYCRKDLARSSRDARRQRLRQTLRGAPLAGDLTLLEVGCGAGFTAVYLADCFREYLGVDYSEELIAYARAHHERPGVGFEAAHINDFRPDRRFDAALAIGVLHHVDDLPGVLGRIRGLLKPGGWFLANEPQPANPAIHLARSIRKRVDPSFASDQRELSVRELRGALGRAGFVDIRLRPQGVFSTPFAEVVLRPETLWVPVARACCVLDRWLEAALGPWLRPISWNLVVAGRNPGAVAEGGGPSAAGVAS